jgi:hypothetical protein
VQDADTIAKNADNTIRMAERDMFNGKKEESDQKLKEALTLIEQLKELDSGHSKLKSLESKYARIRRDLDRRMNKASPAPSASPKPSPPADSGTSGASSNSYEDRRQQADMDRALKKAARDVDYALGKLETLMSSDDSMLARPAPADEKIKNAEGYISEARDYIEKIEEKYSGKLSSPSPELEAANLKIDEAEKKVDSWAKTIKDAESKNAAEKAAAAEKAKASAGAAQRDAESMIQLYEKYYPKFEYINGNSLVYGLTAEDAENALKQIEEVERLLPEFSSELGRLASEYGTESMTIGEKLFKAGYKAGGDPSGKLARLIEATGKIKETRKSSGETVAMNAEILLSAFSNQLNDARIQRMNDAKGLLQVGLQLDPDSAKIQEMFSSIDDQIAEVSLKMEKDIDSKSWAGNIQNFSGPGTPGNLAKEALAYFRNDRDWKVAERDIFGRVIRWRLPIHVAVTDEKLRPRNIARVYELSIVAMEGSPDSAPKKPPFDGYWVGNSWMMRLDKF